MEAKKIDVVATTISGSIKDWSKVKYIIPLFEKYGQEEVSLFTADSHGEARKVTGKLIKDGSRIIISAGGSGTFNSVLEGCLDSKIDLKEIKLGFLRKGSADLLGKVLGMPDNIEEAIRVFCHSINENKTIECDIIRVTTENSGVVPRHFVGYGGVEIFGAIPHISENRFMKYYKGVLGQLFGDLGPFFVAAILALTRKLLREIVHPKTKWGIHIDGMKIPDKHYQTMIIANGDLGPDFPFAKSAPLGSGQFYLVTLEDLGFIKLFGQFRRMWNSSILKNPDKWGFGSYTIDEILEIRPGNPNIFPVNVDGSEMHCRQSVKFEICDQIDLIVR